MVTAKLDRLSRSLHDFTGTVQLARRQRWALVSLDPAVDMTTPNGRLVANILASVAEWESDIIGQRTADAMAKGKARGARYGRERQVAPEVIGRIVAAREAGATYHRHRHRTRRRRHADPPTGHPLVTLNHPSHLHRRNPRGSLMTTSNDRDIGRLEDMIEKLRTMRMRLANRRTTATRAITRSPARCPR